MYRINIGNLDNVINLRIDKRSYEYLVQRAYSLHMSISQYLRLIIDDDYRSQFMEDTDYENI